MSTRVHSEVQELLTSIVGFKQTFAPTLDPKHFRQLCRWIKTLQSLEYIPYDNGHYVTCPYFYDTSEQVIPWHCLCTSSSHIRDSFEKLKTNFVNDE